MSRILQELHREVKYEPVTVLENLMAELKWKRRMIDAGAIEPKAMVRVPRNPHLLVPETMEVQLRWHRQVKPWQLLRCGANMPPFMDSDVMILSRSALKERLEDWFVKVLERI
jgi:hypothetical protein